MSGLPTVCRTFIAIDVPAELKQSISRIQKELSKSNNDRIAWVRMEGVHITLKFIGDVGRDEMRILIDTVRDCAKRHHDFVLRTTIKGGFPRLAQPRTLWIGVDGGVFLINLRDDLELALNGIGFPLEAGKFHPHITVGRVKMLEKNSTIPTKFNELPFQAIAWNAAKVNIMMSQLKPTGAEYGIIEAVSLEA